MSPERLEHLLGMVAPLIVKEDTKMRKSIPPEERLVVTLRFLASGDSQQSLSYSYRIGKSTLSTVISETADAIYKCLEKEYISCPKSEADWLVISDQFEEMWNMPHTIGSIDGKHIRIECPKLSGTHYYNYKGFYSIVLLAVCDARYCFTVFDLGQYGSNNDSGVLANSSMGEKFEYDELNVPASSDRSYDGTLSVGSLPYFLLGEEIFPLKTWLIRPFPGNVTTETQKVYNYRHSRARRVIENAFGILSARWRIFQRPIRAKIENVERFTLACLAMHNYLRLTENASYIPSGFLDSEDSSGNIKPGEWRSIAKDEGALQNLNPIRGSRYSRDAVSVRNTLVEHVNSEEGSVSWQIDYVRRTGN